MMSYKRKEVIGDCTLYLGDCLEVMPTLGKVDAVVTDPPYFKVKGEEWDNQWKKPSEFLKWLGSVLESCSNIMEDWASLYCFASPQMEWYVQGVIREKFIFLNSIRWQKSQGWHKKQKIEDLRIFQQNWEACLFAQKADDSTALLSSGYDSACKDLHKKVYQPIGNYFKLERLAAGFSYQDIAKYISRDPALYVRWEEGSSFPNKVDYNKCQSLFNEHLRKDYEHLRKDYEDLRRPFNIYDRRMKGDIWEYNCVNGYVGKHPCEKPIAIMEHIVCTSTKNSQMVLDPFMGSASTLVACAKMGRKGIGIELDRDYYEIACKRVEEAYKQPDMFVEQPKAINKQEDLLT